MTFPKDFVFEMPDVLKNQDETAQKPAEDRVKDAVDQAKSEYRKSKTGASRGRNGLPNIFGL